MLYVLFKQAHANLWPSTIVVAQKSMAAHTLGRFFSCTSMC